MDSPFLWVANISGWVRLHPAQTALIVFAAIVLLYVIYAIAGG
jgi:hypothetical protein